jgi:hypothetical protein
MSTQHRWIYAVAMALPLAVAVAQESAPQEQAPPPPRSDGGWRRFSDRRPDQRPEQGPPPPQAPSQLTVPAGTWVTLRVDQPISSNHNQAGDSFTGTLAQPLVAQGIVIARRGQTVRGRVSEAVKAGRVQGTSRLALELTELTLVDGQQIPLRTQVVGRKGDTSVGNDVAAVGVTTGAGAAIGAAAAGGFGAGMGAIAGAGASIIGVLTTRGRPTVVYPETLLTFRIDAPITFSTERSYEAFQPVMQEDYEREGGYRQGPPPRFAPRPYYGYPYPYSYGGYYPYYWGPSIGFYGVYGGRGFGHRR